MESNGVLGVLIVIGVLVVPPLVIWLQRKKVKRLESELKLKTESFVKDCNKLQLKIDSVTDLNNQLSPKAKKYDDLGNVEHLVSEKVNDVEVLQKKLVEIQNLIDPHTDHVELIESGFYRFKFDFEDVDKYAEALKIVKDAQKVVIKNKEAVECEVPELCESDIYKSLSKLALMAFHSETEIVMKKVRYNNFGSCKERIEKTYNAINKHLSPVRMCISKNYLNLKVKEIMISFEFEEEKQRIKEEQAEIMAQMREEEASRIEAEKARAKAIEDESKYQSALDDARKEMEGKSDEEREHMLKQIQALEEKLQEAHSERERATSMAQITKAGHVYIISNIGSFGEDMYKIGMTRRKEPMDRVKELGDASVPFKFDVHAMVYTENAPELESSLHNYFNERRVNKVNTRKEFFQVNLGEVQKACDELGYKIKITQAAEAREYRESIEFGVDKAA